MTSPAKQFHDNATTCRRLAEASKDPEQKANWLMLAAEWKRLAEAAAKVQTK